MSGRPSRITFDERAAGGPPVPRASLEKGEETMCIKRTVVAGVVLGVLFMSLWMLPDAAASEGAREPAKALAEMSLSASRADWQPTIDDERLVLTVAGPEDFYIRREFGAGETPSFSSLDVQGGRLPDGIYAYELRRIPRSNSDLRERSPEGPLVQSGHLWVQEGSFVTKIPARPESSIQSESASKPPSNITANTTVPDDLIVQGHACIGDDCVDAAGPPLKIKEFSNYQIKFDALNCCLPSERVWALQANDPAGSNGDFLIRDLTAATIPFRIGAGSPDNTLTTLYNGNVGLGTLTPAVRLDVKASAAGQVTARLQNSSATGHSGIHYLDHAGNIDLYFGIDNAASTTRLDSVNNNPILILTDSTERMRITSGGNVGIGTTSPGAKLQVGAGEVRFPPGAGGAGFTHFNWEGDGRNYIRGTTLIADNGGSVGIGTSTPSSRLHVNGGDIRVSGGAFIDDGVTLNAPDYVFEPSYSLMPLAELREFVSREKHLPNVPAAADIKKEGLNLGQFQMRLLEKIEELALYTLQQEEDVRSLRDENRELKARLEALEKAQASSEPR
jgi:hypothetical protein